MKETTVEIRNLTVRAVTALGARELVAGVNLSLAREEIFMLVGETGSGKSLVGQALTGALPPRLEVSGEVLFEGMDLLGFSQGDWERAWGRQVFLLPQEPLEALDPTMKAVHQVEEIFTVVRGMPRREARRATEEVFGRIGLSVHDEGRRYPCTLSGGMNQRILFAMALATPARFIVVDEPTKGLDPVSRRRVMEMLEVLAAEGKTLLCITHDLGMAARIGGDVAVMCGNTVVEKGPASRVLKEPGDAYTKGLLRALPENGLHPIPEEWMERMRPAGRTPREGD